MADPIKIITLGGIKFNENDIKKTNTSQGGNGAKIYSVFLKNGVSIEFPEQSEETPGVVGPNWRGWGGADPDGYMGYMQEKRPVSHILKPENIKPDVKENIKPKGGIHADEDEDGFKTYQLEEDGWARISPEEAPGSSKPRMVIHSDKHGTMRYSVNSVATNPRVRIYEEGFILKDCHTDIQDVQCATIKGSDNVDFINVFGKSRQNTVDTSDDDSDNFRSDEVKLVGDSNSIVDSSDKFTLEGDYTKRIMKKDVEK